MTNLKKINDLPNMEYKYLYTFLFFHYLQILKRYQMNY